MCHSSTLDQIFLFPQIISFVKAFIGKADIDSGNVRIGLVTFARSVRLEFNLNAFTTKRDVLRAVGRVKKLVGRTNTAGALAIMRNTMFTPDNGDRPDVPNVVVVLTGKDYFWHGCHKEISFCHVCILCLV